MPKRTDISSIHVIGAGLMLASCGEQSSRTETTTFTEPEAGIAECVERFSNGGEAWEDRAVQASFVYDLSDAPRAVAKHFTRAAHRDFSDASVTTVSGAAGETVERFLKNADNDGAHELRANKIHLFRITSGPAEFEQILQQGCARLRDGVGIRQVTFKQGNI